MGMAAGKIPWRAIVSFAHHYGIYDTDNVETLIRHIRAMEYVLIKHESKKNDG